MPNLQKNTELPGEEISGDQAERGARAAWPDREPERDLDQRRERLGAERGDQVAIERAGKPEVDQRVGQQIADRQRRQRRSPRLRVLPAPAEDEIVERS